MSVDTSYPVGAVTAIFAVKLVPDTEKLSDAPATPLHAVNEPIEPDVLMVGTDVVKLPVNCVELYKLQLLLVSFSYTAM